MVIGCVVIALASQAEASRGKGLFNEYDFIANIVPMYLEVVEELEVANIGDGVSCIVHVGAFLEVTSKNEQGFILARVVQLGRASAEKKDAVTCPMGKEFIVPPNRYE